MSRFVKLALASKFEGELMAVAFLTAVRRFLVAMTTSPDFETVRSSQFQHCRVRLRSLTSLSYEEASEMVEMLASMNWNETQLYTLQTEVNDRLAALMDSADANRGPRRSLQNYQNFTAYLTEGLWCEIMSLGQGGNPSKVLSSLVTHLAKLGLRLPSEKTMSKITALMLMGQNQSLNQMEKHSAYLAVKSQMKKQLEYTNKNYQDRQHVVELPENPNDFRGSWFDLAFQNALPRAEGRKQS